MVDLPSPNDVLKLLLTLSVILIAHFALKTVQRARRLKELPGPPNESLFAGNLQDIKSAQVGTRYNVWQKQYGRAYRIRGALSESILVLSDAKAVNYILCSKPSNYVRPDIDRYVLESWFGKGLFSAEGAEHRRMRKTLNGAFTPQSVEEISPIFFELAEKLKGQWEELLQSGPSSGIINVSNSLHMLSLDAISMATFSSKLSSLPHITDLLHKLSNPPSDTPVLLEVLVNIYPQLLNLPSEMKNWATMFKKELGSVAKSAWSKVERGRGQEERRKGGYSKVLDLMDASKTADGQAISHEEAVAQIIGILFAGSESTANVISECLYELSRNSSVQDRLRKELLDLEADFGRVPVYEELLSSHTLPYLDAVTREVCRTKAVLMDISRVAAEEDIIPLSYPLPSNGKCEVRVQPGQIVNVSVRDGMNVNPIAWGDNAETFVPERWLEKSG